MLTEEQKARKRQRERERHRKFAEWLRTEATPEEREKVAQYRRDAAAIYAARHPARKKRQYQRWARQHGEQRRVYMRKWNAANRKLNRERMRAYRARNLEKLRRWERGYQQRRKKEPGAELRRFRNFARHMLHTAVRLGMVTKPERCERCAKGFPKRLLHGHHHKGYERPLDVQWLCPLCHKAVERGE